MNSFSNSLIPNGLDSRRRLDGQVIQDRVRVITLREFSGEVWAGDAYRPIGNQKCPPRQPLMWAGFMIFALGRSMHQGAILAQAV